MRRHHFPFVILAICVHIPVLAQTATAEKSEPLGKNIIYLEAGGVSHIYSLNYQRNFGLSEKVDFGAGISLSPALYPHKAEPNRSNFGPRASLLAQAIYKIDRHEIGLGVTWGYYTWHYRESLSRPARYQKINSFAMGQLGYSYTMKNGLYLGAYYTPGIMDYGDFWFVHWGGVRIGYRF